MVIAWIHLLLLLPCFLFSAEFTASVNRNEVGLGEGFMLKLTLKDASAQSRPSIESLKREFTVHSQHQSSNTTIHNGKVSSTVTWSFNLIPQTAGDILILPISIESSAGKLSTQPIVMRINREKKSHEGQAEDEVRVETEASNTHPYKNEPFLLTVRLISKRALTNLQAQKFEVQDAIAEPAEEPRVLERVDKGVKVGVVEFTYLITPLKSGSLKIPPITVQGSLPQRRNSRSFFDGRSLFDDPFDSFSLMQGFANLQPFALATKEVTMDIRPPADSTIVPWLPAKSLSIQENWDNNQTFREGEVFTRSFVMEGEGIHSSQLPSLEGRLDGNGLFKVYADKPEVTDEIINGKLKSRRTEQYTLIPQKSGHLLLPEISVAWWDTGKGEKRLVTIPSHPLQVLPALEKTPSNPSLENDLKEENAQTSTPSIAATHPFVYGLIGVLAALLAVVLVLLFLMRRKMNQLLGVPAEKPIQKQKEKTKTVIPTISVINAPPRRRKRESLDDLNPT